MPNKKVTILVDPTRELQRQLQRAARRGVSTAPGWALAGEYLVRKVQENFDAEGNRPNKWADLAESTLRSRRGKGTKILTRTGAMRNSIKYVADNVGVTIGTDNIEYASFHQDGTKKMPQREFITWPQNEIRTAGEIVMDYVLGELGR